MTRLQVAAAVIVGYWLGRGHRKKLGMLLAAAGAGRLAGGPQEMVDRATGLLQSSPEFAELSESVRGQLLDAVKVAAMTAVTARVDALNNRLLAGSDEVLATAESLVEDTAHMAGDAAGDTVGTAGDVGGDTVGTVGDVAGGTVGAVGKLAGGTLGAVGAPGRRKRAKKAPPPDDSDEGDDDTVDTVVRRKRPKKAPPPDDRNEDDEDDETAEQAEERPARRPPRSRSDEPPRTRTAQAKPSGSPKRGAQR